MVTPRKEYAARSGTAVLGRDAKVPLNGYFRIGSNTKTFAAAVVLQLEAEGRLSLKDSVERWLPGLVQGNGNEGNKITIRNLLQHTSGLYDHPHDVEKEMASMRLSCGTVWSHTGGTPGFITGNAVTADGRTSVITSESTDSQSSATGEPRQRLIDHAICSPSGAQTPRT